MSGQKVKPTYTFVDPNTPDEFLKALKKILIDKLLNSQESCRKASNI